jgi:hypothetical protein
MPRAQPPGPGLGPGLGLGLCLAGTSTPRIGNGALLGAAARAGPRLLASAYVWVCGYGSSSGMGEAEGEGARTSKLEPPPPVTMTSETAGLRARTVLRRQNGQNQQNERAKLQRRRVESQASATPFSHAQDPKRIFPT